ncbi:hypothetical protein [uncultured Devosia sp.]|uniref:hypothetical protein n=1 Tax=uncultured Devosia sp. TaxID=211434 RepID=UPI002605C207|nr:hypothetical protein [uncultured Devosia sp.]
MTRPLPHIREPEVTAMAVFCPNGVAFLEVGFAGHPDIPFTREQVAQLKEKIENFERQCLFEDGRPDERHRIHREAL